MQLPRTTSANKRLSPKLKCITVTFWCQSLAQHMMPELLTGRIYFFLMERMETASGVARFFGARDEKSKWPSLTELLFLKKKKKTQLLTKFTFMCLNNLNSAVCHTTRSFSSYALWHRNTYFLRTALKRPPATILMNPQHAIRYLHTRSA